MEEYTKPLADLARDAREHVDLQIQDAKLLLAKGMSITLGQFLSLLAVLLILAGALLALGAGCTLLLGLWLGSYWIAAFIMAGVYILLALLVYLFSGKVLVNSFVKMFTGVLFDDRKEDLL